MRQWKPCVVCVLGLVLVLPVGIAGAQVISQNMRTRHFDSCTGSAPFDRAHGCPEACLPLDHPPGSSNVAAATMPPGYFEPSIPPDMLDAPSSPGTQLNVPVAHNIGANDGRLQPYLRQAARLANPLACTLPLASYHNALGPGHEARLGQAYADLSVTGHNAFAAFRLAPPTAAYCAGIAARVASLPTGCPSVQMGSTSTSTPTNAQLLAGCVKALNRAYLVARFLRTGQTIHTPNWFLLPGDPPNARGGLGWIAVSGEDDSPHRPVNVPASHFPQYDLNVVVPTPLVAWPAISTSTLTVRTRFTVAQLLTPPPAAPTNPLWSLAPEPPPTIPPNSDVILFIHGMGSRAEEANDITRELFKLLAPVGKNIVIISVDLPSSGYADNIDYLKVSPMASIGNPKITPNPAPPPGLIVPGFAMAIVQGVFTAQGLPPPPVPVIPSLFPLPDFQATGRTPVLDFIEEFIVSFVNTLDSPTVPIKHNLKAVMGGSLGGSMSFRLGRRPGLTWPKYVIVWSPASIWKSLGEGFDITKHMAVLMAWLDAAKREPSDLLDLSPARLGNRKAFFDGWDKPLVPGVVPAQCQQWQSDYDLCKESEVAGARLDRHETYDSFFNLWSARLAVEQLLYSHQTTVSPANATPVDPLTNHPRFMSNHVPMLLACGVEDKFNFTDICPATQSTAAMMSTPGEALFYEATGHSVDNERKVRFARDIAEFLGYLPPPPPSAPGVSCDVDSDCASSRCDAAPGNPHLCIPRDGTGAPGVYCTHNNQCSNGSCFGSVCEVARGVGQTCQTNAGCSTGRCDAGFNTTGHNRCTCSQPNCPVGAYCTNNNQCQSGRCNASGGGEGVCF